MNVVHAHIINWLSYMPNHSDFSYCFYVYDGIYMYVYKHCFKSYIIRFKIVLNRASLAPGSSRVYFWTCDVIVFIIFDMATVY